MLGTCDAPSSGNDPRPVVRINFSDFWGHFDKTDNYFWNLLSKSFRLEISSDPDFLIYSTYGREFTRFDCFRIFFTGERVTPDFSECDFAFSFDYMEDSRQYRLPLYALYADNDLLTQKPVDAESILHSKSRFCNFVVSNGSCAMRNEFFLRLSRYKRVDSAGRFMNNMETTLGPAPQDKWNFLRPYKFTIAFESSSYPGYTTEKIFEPMLMNSLPLYWGNPLVGRDFNSRSFLSYHEFPNEDAFIDRIIEADNDDKVYLDYMSQPWFIGNKVNSFVDPASVTKRFDLIFSQLGRRRPVATTGHRFVSAAKGAILWGGAKLQGAKVRACRILPRAPRV